jgi:squalene-hopene/tetraprenyl-beta-curcumene cyclase
MTCGCFRRDFLKVVLPGLFMAGGCREDDTSGNRIDRALTAAMRALITAQSSDGSWRSRTYGALKDGLSLTPPILKALVFGPGGPETEAACRRGARYLVLRTRTDGAIVDEPQELIYPVYTASASAIALSRINVDGGAAARDAWLVELRRRQMTESLGWGTSDRPFGAWGYAIDPPSRPAGGLSEDQPLDADLSSTLFAVGALRINGASAEDPAIRKALVFICRCQNLAEEGTEGDQAFDDGGFFFTPTDPVRNKAGAAGNDRRGQVRHHSYGSATADGVRALLRCGLAIDHPRVVAALRWLQRRFSPRVNAGTFEPGRALERAATYYYYAWSATHAFRALGIRSWTEQGREVRWAEELAEELIAKQRPDGTWANSIGASKEDDPLVATPLAAGALALARAALPG